MLAYKREYEYKYRSIEMLKNYGFLGDFFGILFDKGIPSRVTLTSY